MSLTKNCCHADAGKAAVAGNTAAFGYRSRFARRFRAVTEWLLPSVILVILPKCPLCIIAYIAVATGFGLSLSVATNLRIFILVACVTVLAYAVAKYLFHLTAMVRIHLSQR
jgi:hypothetical protein